MQGDNLKSYLHLHFIVFVWGFTAVLGALISLDALPLVWFRMCIAVSLIFLFAVATKTPMKVPTRTFLGFMAAGLVIAMHWFTFFHAIKVSNISITLACLSTGALFATLLESVVYRRRLIGYEILMGFIVVLGLCIIIYGEQLTVVFGKIMETPSDFWNILADGTYTNPGHYWGILLALSSAFLSATFSIINGKYAKEHNPVVISLYELMGGVFFFSLYLLFTGSFTADFFALSGLDWIWLFILGSFCTAYAFIASVQVMKFISPYTVMLTINMEPVYGIILALIVFKEKEKMGWTFYIGAIIILSTVIINGILKNKPKIESN
ncbi:EamA family transporter [Flavobacterium album]|uniref:EamA family transporter n=1 Tax=Flavobacterium album TaxID=2175091 RepID=A0A2S1QYT5_9FLAO|nr:DMT family transporter [Flavobacterium album]AWH85401.1 EamA family transporter [Flavobacterium album]